MSPAPASILVVEDSSTQALLLQNILERHNFAVTLAREGSQALEKLAEARPFLVITDIQMPGMDGYELCRRLKAVDRALPVMLLTSLSSPVDIIQGLECGADNFVVKPYEEAFLLSRIQAIQEEVRQGRPEAADPAISIAFEGKQYVINSGRRQILNLLLSTYEAVARTNRELVSAHDRLKAAQAQLIEAEKLQSIGRLASGVAHEIRNPLAIIEMAGALLAEHPREEDVPVLGEVREAVQRANVVIDKLADLSLPRQLGVGAVEVRQVLEASLAPLAASLAEAGITVRREFDQSPSFVRLDLAKMEQVFGNIIANARDAMAEAGGGELCISSSSRVLDAAPDPFDPGDRVGRRLRAGDRVVEIRFADTGSGFAPEMLTRVFDPFFSTKPTGKGVGLGLTVARKIVELHGGRLEVGNRPGGGAEVILLLHSEEAP